MILKIDSDIELKPLEQADSKDIFDVIDHQREYLGEFLPFVEMTKEVADTEKYVDSVINVSADSCESVFTIRKKNVFIGLIGLKDTDRHNKKSEIGYWLSEQYQKQGIMTKVVAELCDFAFNWQGINRIQIKCAVGNMPSKKIPQRLGFTFEGIERQGELLTGNIFTDIEIYSKLKSD